ncbi:LuxR C-terminal-related transcriptional regulator [Moheibacter sp.]|uniref:helix-turn-helix transcriptional regulator n=1 Tax=Moheibacter sp. TaxID=1965316 RepID=UPI003C714150
MNLFREVFFRKGMLVLYCILVYSGMLFSQTTDPIKLNKEITALNNAYKYDSAIIKLEEIINHPSSTSIDRYYAYIEKALTYKRLYNYAVVLNNLNYAVEEGRGTAIEDHAEARVKFEKMFIHFDLLDFQQARYHFDKITERDLELVDPPIKAFYWNVAGTFKIREGKYEEAEAILRQGIAVIENENPEHLPAVYCKLVNLAEHTRNPELAEWAFEKGIYYSKKYGIDIYKIRMHYDMSHFYLKMDDYKNAYFHERMGSELSGVYNAPVQSGNLNLLERELWNKRRDLERTYERNVQIFLVILSVILLAFLIVLFQFFKINKQKRYFIELENERMRQELEEISKNAGKSDSELILEKYNLSDRQLQIIELVKQGKTNKEIGNELFISENTVKYHLKIIYNVLGIENRFDLK